MKLSTQIQNTWPRQNVILRVIRAWIKPPPNYKRVQSKFNLNPPDTSLVYKKPTKSHQNLIPDQKQSDIFSVQRPLNFKDKNIPIIDMTPDMMTDQIVYASKFGKYTHSNLNNIPFKSNYFDNKKINFLSHDLYKTDSFGKLSVPYAAMPIDQNSLVYYQKHTKTNRLNKYYNKFTHKPSYLSRIKRYNPVGSSSFNNMHVSNFNSKSNNLHYMSQPHHQQGRHYQQHPKPHKQQSMFSIKFNQMNEMEMEEFHYTGRAIDFELTTRSLAKSKNSNLRLGVLAQMAYYVAQFDWCSFNPIGHVHCSVKPGIN